MDLPFKHLKDTDDIGAYWGITMGLSHSNWPSLHPFFSSLFLSADIWVEVIIGTLQCQLVKCEN